uniref:Uncharacterized protein n=1 Tax=Romanomermis culicivorax TaxID=13658 RepID=A0A915K7H7_ROMCU
MADGYFQPNGTKISLPFSNAVSIGFGSVPSKKATLFYFVGHGFEIGGQCYLLPVDAPGENYTSFGEGAYEICGEINGIFMKYFMKHIEKKKPITEILNFTMRDLPDPIKVRFDELNLLIMIWFDFCGHFVNLIYIFTTVYSGAFGVIKSDSFDGRNSIVGNSSKYLHETENVDHENSDRQDNPSTELMQDATAKKYLAYLRFEPTVHCADHVLCEDQDEDRLTSVRLLVRNLQRYKHLTCTLELVERETDKMVSRKDIVELPKMLIGKLSVWEGD